MKSNLTLWMPDRPGAAWAWMDKSGQSGWVATREEKSELANLSNGSVTVIIPGQWVRVFSHNLPNMRASDRLNAAGFSIEDELAASISEQHIVLGNGDDKRIGVISRMKMEQLSDALGNVGLKAQHILADFDILTGDVPIDVMGRTIHPGKTGYSFDNEDVSSRHPNIMSDRLDMSSALEFAQGEFASRPEFSLASGQWMRIAALVLVTGLAWLVWQGAQGRAINVQTQDIRDRMNTLYTQTTGEPAPSNVAAVVNRASRTGQSGGDFISLSSALISGLSQHDTVMIDTIRYDGRRNELSLRLIYPDFETAGQLEAIFDGRGQRFVSGAVREQGDSLVGEAVFSFGGQS